MADIDLEKEVLDEKRTVTDRISETTRYIGFGLLAIFYGIVTSNEAFPRALQSQYPLVLKFIALCGFLAIVLDYLQYVFGRRATQNALSRTDAPFHYNRTWFSYRARTWCFLVKQAAALLGSIAFILIVLRTV